MATCDLATLLRDGKCFCGATTNKKDIAELQLLCNILSAVGGGGGTVQDMQVAWTPTNVKLGEVMNFASTNVPNQLAGITSLTFNQSVLTTVDIEQAPNLVSIAFPNLTSFDTTNGFIEIGPGVAVLTTISFPLLTDIGNIFINSVAATSLSFPSAANCTGAQTFNVSQSAQLTTISWPLFVTPPNGMIMNAGGCALNAAFVNDFLHRCVNNAGFVTGNINFQAGTNAAPSGQGIADKATLIGRGVTVTTN